MNDSYEIPFHKGEESRVECIWLFKLICLLTKEEHTLINELTEDKPQDFTEVATGYKFLEGMSTEKNPMKPRSTSKDCSSGLLDVLSIIMSYFVRGRCSCSNESKAPWIIKQWVNQRTCLAKQLSTDPFAVDRHFLVRRNTKILDFVDVPHLLHVRSIATGSENDTDLCTRVDVVRGNKCSCRIIDEGGDLDRDVL